MALEEALAENTRALKEVAGLLRKLVAMDASVDRLKQVSALKVHGRPRDRGEIVTYDSLMDDAPGLGFTDQTASRLWKMLTGQHVSRNSHPSLVHYLKLHKLDLRFDATNEAFRKSDLRRLVESENIFPKCTPYFGKKQYELLEAISK